jgi:hypothetical protein
MILETVVRNAMADAAVDLVDGGTGAGYIEIQTSGDVEVATLPFSATAFGGSSSGTATAAAITSDTSATGGTAAQASIFDGDDTKLWENTVGTSGAEINLTTLTIGAGVTVSMSAYTFTMPAS